MADEIDRHNEMVNYIVVKTGLDRERVRVILYAGEPWLEYERFLALLNQSFQHSESTGTDPTGPLDAMNSLLLLEIEHKECQDSKGQNREDFKRIQDKVERVANIAGESTETVHQVVGGMLVYYYGLLKICSLFLGCLTT